MKIKENMFSKNANIWNFIRTNSHGYGVRRLHVLTIFYCEAFTANLCGWIYKELQTRILFNDKHKYTYLESLEIKLRIILYSFIHPTMATSVLNSGIILHLLTWNFYQNKYQFWVVLYDT